MTELTILLVEENLLMAAALEQVLSTSGHEVVMVSDGSAALKVLEERDVDVILNDIDLAEMEGVAMYESLPCDMQRRVIFLAGALSQHAVPPGARLLQKPSRGVLLRQAVQQVAAAA